MVVVAFFFGGVAAVELLCPLLLSVEWVRLGGTEWEPVNKSTTMRTRTTATAVAGPASRRGRWLMEIIALSRWGAGGGGAGGGGAPRRRTSSGCPGPPAAVSAPGAPGPSTQVGPVARHGRRARHPYRALRIRRPRALVGDLVTHRDHGVGVDGLQGVERAVVPLDGVHVVVRHPPGEECDSQSPPPPLLPRSHR